MIQRVECRHCKCHRDLATTPRCLVCGRESFTGVELDAQARAAIDAEVLVAAEMLATVLDYTYVELPAPLVRPAKQLRDAVRIRAAALEGKRIA